MWVAMHRTRIDCLNSPLIIALVLLICPAVYSASPQWGNIEGTIDASILQTSDENRPPWVYVYLYKPIAIHQAYPQSTQEVREAYQQGFAQLNGTTLDAWSNEASKKAIKTEDVPDFPGPSILFSQENHLNGRYVFIREGEFLPVINLSKQTHCLNLAAGAKRDTAPVLRPGQFDMMSLTSLFDVPFPATCTVHDSERIVMQVLPHPYFVKVDRSGKFALKHVPAGTNRLAIATHDGCFSLDGKPGTCRGTKVEVPVNGTLQLGEIKLHELHE